MKENPVWSNTEKAKNQNKKPRNNPVEYIPRKTLKKNMLQCEV